MVPIVLLAILTSTPLLASVAGITPDSPLYFLDLLWDQIRLAVAKLMGPKAYASTLASIVKERVAEFELMKERNETALAERTMIMAMAEMKALEKVCEENPSCSMYANETAHFVEHFVKGKDRMSEAVKEVAKDVAESVHHTARGCSACNRTCSGCHGSSG